MGYLAAAAEASEKSEGSDAAFVWATLVVLILLVILHFLIRGVQSKIDDDNKTAANADLDKKAREANEARTAANEAAAVAATSDDAQAAAKAAAERAKRAEDAAQTAAENAEDAAKGRKTGRKGLATLVIGSDNRWSTSKLQVVLWTITIVWALFVIIFWVGGSGAEIEDSFEKAFDIQGEYLILLGFPATAGLVAKALTGSRVANGEMVKEDAARANPATIVTNDAGDADLGDWQYFLFNIVALTVFYRLFISDPGDGLPALPDTLVALTGASAAIYVGKKATERQKAPTIMWVKPATLDLTTPGTIEIGGTGFVPVGDEPPDLANPPTSTRSWVSLGGFPVTVSHWDNQLIKGMIEPATFSPVAERSNVELIVYNTTGVASAAFSVNLVQPATS